MESPDLPVAHFDGAFNFREIFTFLSTRHFTPTSERWDFLRL
jgi:hypothetical protein